MSTLHAEKHTIPTGDSIPMAVDVNPNSLVERTYPDFTDPTMTRIDVESTRVMGDYLESRFVPEKPFDLTLTMEPTGKTLPKIERVPVGVRSYPWLQHDGWSVSPETALKASLLGLLVVNVAANIPNVITAAQDLGDEARQVGHGIYRHFNPVPDVLVPGAVVNITPGKTVTISVDAAASSKAGQNVVDPTAVQKFSDGVNAQMGKGGRLKEVIITGRSSDEYSTDKDIGVLEKTNNDLSDRRAAAYAEPITRSLGANAIKPKLTAVQDVISQELKAQLQADAKRLGFSSLTDAIRKVESGAQTDPSFQKAINEAFTAKRGVTMQATVELPGEDEVEVIRTEHYEPGVDNPPENPDRDYDGKFIPFLIPPLPRFRKIMKDAIKRAWKLVPGKELMIPKILKTPRDMAWVRLRPEALQEDGTLVDMPWAYSRKYEHLMRDGRIADILCGKFKNAEGKDKELRIMFIDKSPAAETVEEFEGLIKQFAAMRGGSLADKITGIFVYPESSAGDHHSNPKKIGVGVDKQDDEGVLGFCAPALELVEMHMKETQNPDELREYFADYMGALWTLSHEAAGHGTGIRSDKVKLLPVRSRLYDNAYISSDPWEDRMENNYNQNLPLNYRRRAKWFDRVFRGRNNDDKLIFDAEFPVLDRNGNVVTIREQVDANDPRLQHATRVHINGRDVTRYAGTNPAELQAETAASAVTGIEVPYSEAGAKVNTIRTTDDGTVASFAQGYLASHRDMATYSDIIGAKTGTVPVEFDNPPQVDITYTKPENDRVMQEHYKRARSQRTLRPEEMIAILSHAVGRKVG
ncbi:MAG: hypothetical protein WAQ24_00170 [Candidatus Saccharimonadales bacterium]